MVELILNINNCFLFIFKFRVNRIPELFFTTCFLQHVFDIRLRPDILVILRYGEQRGAPL